MKHQPATPAVRAANRAVFFETRLGEMGLLPRVTTERAIELWRLARAYGAEQANRITRRQWHDAGMPERELESVGLLDRFERRGPAGPGVGPAGQDPRTTRAANLAGDVTERSQ